MPDNYDNANAERAVPFSKPLMSRWVAVLLGATVLYFAVPAYFLHFNLSRILFPESPHVAAASPDTTTRVKGKSGNEVLVRRYGQAKAGCLIFFPGQHGMAPSYNLAGYASAGLAVFSLAYPGQDGASGHVQVDAILPLVAQAITAIGEACPPNRTVFVGVSLGAMLAAYASQSVRPAGVVLVSAAPSLSSAIRVRLRSHFYLAPISLLPLSALLPHDYSLTEAFGQGPGVPVVAFQGTADEQTPLVLFRKAAAGAAVRLVEVPGGTHSTTFARSQTAQIPEILDMLRSCCTTR